MKKSGKCKKLSERLNIINRTKSVNIGRRKVDVLEFDFGSKITLLFE